MPVLDRPGGRPKIAPGPKRSRKERTLPTDADIVSRTIAGRGGGCNPGRVSRGAQSGGSVKGQAGIGPAITMISSRAAVCGGSRPVGGAYACDSGGIKTRCDATIEKGGPGTIHHYVCFRNDGDAGRNPVVCRGQTHRIAGIGQEGKIIRAGKPRFVSGPFA